MESRVAKVRGWYQLHDSQSVAPGLEFATRNQAYRVVRVLWSDGADYICEVEKLCGAYAGNYVTGKLRIMG